jgi:hypothetical protein
VGIVGIVGIVVIVEHLAGGAHFASLTFARRATAAILLFFQADGIELHLRNVQESLAEVWAARPHLTTVAGVSFPLIFFKTLARRAIFACILAVADLLELCRRNVAKVGAFTFSLSIPVSMLLCTAKP